MANFGSVTVLNTPGHPDHHSTLVKLSQKGSVLITGGVPWFSSTARADTDLDRPPKGDRGKSNVIIQHDARDLKKLPAFPAAAR